MKNRMLTFTENHRVGLWRFIDSISCLGRASDIYGRIYEEHCSSDDIGRQIAKDLHKMFNALPCSFDLGKYPGTKSPSQQYIEPRDLVYQFAYASSNTVEFMQLIQGLLPLPRSKQVFLAIEHFSPIYKKLIVKHSRKGMKSLIERLTSKTMSDVSARLLDNIFTFFGTEIPVTGLSVALVPLPRKFLDSSCPLATKAISLGPLQVIEVVTPSKMLNFYDVVMHEITHYAYELSDSLNHAYKAIHDSDLPLFKVIAGMLFNEALATAIGNGYIRKHARLPEKDMWYADPLYDGCAKAIYPIVDRYLSSSLTIDANFGLESAKSIKKAFPELMSRVDVLFRESISFAGSSKFDEAYKILLPILNIPSIYAYTENMHLPAQECLSDQPSRTLIVFVPFSKTLDKTNYPVELPQAVTTAASKSKVCVHAEQDNTGRWNVYFICDDISDVERMAKNLVERAQLEHETVYI